MNMNLIEIWNKDVLDNNTFDMRIIEKIIDYHRYVLTENNNKLDREQHYNPDEGIIIKHILIPYFYKIHIHNILSLI